MIGKNSTEPGLADVTLPGGVVGPRNNSCRQALSQWINPVDSNSRETGPAAQNGKLSIAKCIVQEPPGVGAAVSSQSWQGGDPASRLSQRTVNQEPVDPSVVQNAGDFSIRHLILASPRDRGMKNPDRGLREFGSYPGLEGLFHVQIQR